MRILLAIPSLRCGGSERVLSMLADHWAGGGHEVALATFEPPETDFFALDRRVRRFVIGGSGASAGDWLQANRGRLRKLRAAVRESGPDVVLSFLYTMNLVAVVAARGLAPVVVAERTDPRAFRVEWWQAALRRALYPAAAAVVVQTQTVRDGWARRVTRRSRAYAIPNPVLPPGPSLPWDGTPLREPFVASIGRLDRHKGFDVLIDAFAMLASEHPAWSLAILGEGALRPELAAQARRLGIEERVVLAGSGVSEAFLASASVFATASRLEGFPNALLEAMAAGLPVVATDCRSGPRDIVRHGVDGYLVPVDDAQELAAALGLLLADEGLRRRLGLRGCEVRERFGIERVGRLWEQVFAEVVARGTDHR